LRTTENIVRNNISVPLTQNRFDALVSLAYNIGYDNFITSSIAQYINNPEFQSQRFQTPEAAWKAFNTAQRQIINGLINRRNDEWDLYINGIY
jgi:type VI secretion system secreted protein VgrG